MREREREREEKKVGTNLDMSLTMLKALLPLQHMPHSTFSLTILKSV
jgi:hypothetical protein